MAQQRAQVSGTKGGAQSGSQLPSAKDLRQKIAVVESEKASLAVRKAAAEEAEKKKLIAQLSKPSGLSDDELMRRGNAIIQRAVNAGRMSVQIYRFPNALCTDHGRAINQREAGWEKSLTGAPKELYLFWERRLKPLGYRIRYEIVDFPDGMPGDVGVTLSWE
jgi:hypothetical protein